VLPKARAAPRGGRRPPTSRRALRQLAVRAAHDVLALALERQVQVHAAAGHALVELGHEGRRGRRDGRDRAHQPAQDGEPAAQILDRGEVELDLVLLDAPAVELGIARLQPVDVADLGVAVLDAAVSAEAVRRISSAMARPCR